jgi:hypothetical protein
MQKLVITFCDKSLLEETIDKLQSTYNILFGKMYVFQTDEIENEYLISYNVEIQQNEKLYDNTVVCHRRKDEVDGSITIFTMNGLNYLKNKMGDDFKWSDYDKCFILIRDEKFTSLKLQLQQIFTTNN